MIVEASFLATKVLKHYIYVSNCEEPATKQSLLLVILIHYSKNAAQNHYRNVKY